MERPRRSVATRNNTTITEKSVNGRKRKKEAEPVKKPIKKVPKKESNSDSGSSSDEFERMKTDPGPLMLKEEVKAELDFEAIESNIFDGVTRLSDSESDSDFEEVKSGVSAGSVVINPLKSEPVEADSVSDFKKAPSKKLQLSKLQLSKLRKAAVNGLTPKDKDKDQVEVKAVKEEEDVSESKNNQVTTSDKKNEGKPIRANKRTPAAFKDITVSSTKDSTSAPKGKKTHAVTKTNQVESTSKQSSVKGKASEKNQKSKVDSKPQRSLSVRKKPTEESSTGSKSKSKEPKPRKPNSKNDVKSASTKDEPGSSGSKIPLDIDNLDMNELLALGENLGVNAISQVGLTTDSEASEKEDDWEEVNTEGGEEKQHVIPKEGVQITLEMPGLIRRRQKKKEDMQAVLNRQLNRVRREFQVLFHKVSVLCWLAHGFYVNRVLNSEELLAVALSLVPSNHCLPPAKVDLKYVQQITAWFVKLIDYSEGFTHIDEDHSQPVKCEGLERQFARRVAKSKRDLAFLFICILRAVDVDARLVISFQPMPLKPQSSELFSIKPPKEKSSRKEGSASSTEEKTEKTSIKESPNKIAKETVVKSKPSTSKPTANTSRATGPKSRVTAPKRKSEDPPPGAPSPRKTRSGAVRKSYKEDSPDSDSEADVKSSSHKKDAEILKDSKKSEVPLLSPKKRSLSEEEKEKLKKIAEKRIPTVRRRVAATIKVEHEDLDAKHSKSNSEEDGDGKEPVLSPKKKSLSGQEKEKLKKIVDKRTPSVGRRSAATKKEEDGDFVPKNSKSDSEEDGDSDFTPESRKKGKMAVKTSKERVKKETQTRKPAASSAKKPRKGLKVLSSSDDEGQLKSQKKMGTDYWVEIYIHKEESWVPVDVTRGKVDCAGEIKARATQPITYVVAWNRNNTVKDVTRRYAPQFSQVTAKQRVEEKWWNKTMKPYKPRSTAMDKEEESQLHMAQLNRPMPTSVAECKNHPLYALKRHLLKFEAIYPADAPTLGFVKSEPLYARQNVYTLHSRELWIKEAKVVRLGEKPYKIVKARPKYDRMSGNVITDLPLELFGPWQVEDYDPPSAVDGKVPRNAYGNVELFKPSMLPKGCVHLQLPSLNRIAKKLQIDCAPAVVGFDYHCGGSHPTYDGFVVCEEHVDILSDAWTKEIEESEKRQHEREEKRIYGNWRRLIRGLLIREHLNFRYDFKEDEPDNQPADPIRNEIAAAEARLHQPTVKIHSAFPKLMAKMRSGRGRKSTGPSTSGTKKPSTTAQPKAKGKPARKKRNQETSSEEEETDLESSSSEDEAEAGMVLLSDEDSGSEFDYEDDDEEEEEDKGDK